MFIFLCKISAKLCNFVFQKTKIQYKQYELKGKLLFQVFVSLEYKHWYKKLAALWSVIHSYPVFSQFSEDCLSCKEFDGFWLVVFDRIRSQPEITWGNTCVRVKVKHLAVTLIPWAVLMQAPVGLLRPHFHQNTFSWPSCFSTTSFEAFSIFPQR